MQPSDATGRPTVRADGRWVLDSPPFDVGDAERLAEPWFDDVHEVVDLGSHQDRNFLLRTPRGSYVLKVANPSFGRAALELQNAAMAHVAAAGLATRTPEAVAGRDGQCIVVAERGGERYDVRVLTYIEGETLRTWTDTTGGAALLGRVAASVSAALAEFRHPAAARVFGWSLDHAADVLAALLVDVDEEHRATVERALERFTAARSTFAPELPRQVIHGDVTEYNLVVRGGAFGVVEAAGLIDFGDVSSGLRVAEAAIAAAAAARHVPGDPLRAVAETVRAFHAVSSLSVAEASALFPLVAARAAVSAATNAHQAALEPANLYTTAVVERFWRYAEAVEAIPPALGVAVCRVACGHRARPRPGPAPAESGPVVDPRGATPVAVDLSPGSDRYVEGDWAAADGLRADLVVPDGHIAVGRWGERRLLDGSGVGDDEPSTVQLGVDLFVAAGTPVLAPVPGTVRRPRDGEVVIEHDTGEGAVRLVLGGLAVTVDDGVPVTRGEVVGTAAEPRQGPWPVHVRVQTAVEPIDDLPAAVPAWLAEAWLALCPDPSALIGVAAAAPPPARDEVLARRRRTIAGAQRLYYADPPEIVRGRRHVLYDADGRGYVDVVNNVAVVGHGHPGVAAAAARQLRLLNTNSRFLYDAMGRFGERLVELLPASLDTVFLVNSGSEANELALRLARAATGHRGVISLWGSYHGWTSTLVGLSSSPFYPDSAANLSPEVRVVPAPNPYRNPLGPAVGGEAGPQYAAAVAEACTAAAADGDGVAAFISEPQLGNAGGVLSPPGFLRSAYAHVRAAGGVCIADEVQVGYARLGRWFWAFEQQDAVPDIVTVAKPAGNGHPLGAVVTTRAIADSFGRRTTIFSSVGGSPVSCEVGIAVLDAIRDEGLQHNALRVGERLRERLLELADRHALIGAVHGGGLHLGVELVLDRDSREPAVAVADMVCERMLRHGVVVRPTGDHNNVLKVKPPLTFDDAAADRFVDALDHVLHQGTVQAAGERDSADAGSGQGAAG